MIRPVLWLILFLCAGSPVFASERTRQPHPAVVRIMAVEGDGVSWGSGTLVATNHTYGLIVTNWHVVRGAKGPVMVMFSDGFRSAATVMKVDRDWDLAALSVWRPNVRPVSLATNAPRPGDVLTIAGYGSGGYRAVSGRCTQYVAPLGNFPSEMVELSAAARNGDSGGPIFNQEGHLAGVLFGSARGQTTGSYAGRVRWFLASAARDLGRLPVPPHRSPVDNSPNASDVEVIAANPTDASRQRLPAAVGRRQSPEAELTSPTRPPAAVIGSVRSIPPNVGDTPPRQSATYFGPVASNTAAISVPKATAPTSGAALPSPAAPTPSATNVSESSLPLAATRTRADQIETILAIVGVLALLFHGLRLLGRTLVT